MNKKILGLALAGLFAAVVQAVPITGSVDMSGTVFLNNAALGSATGATSFTGVTVGGLPTGSYSTVVPGTSVTWSAFTWAPFNGPITPLWSFMSGGMTYSFSLGAVSVKEQDNSFLNLLGSGTLKITGGSSNYEDTHGVWSLTISNPSELPHANFAFTFANSQTAVPDGGSTLMLLGGALLGLAATARRFLRLA